ncbi:uncharacterized protein LOC108088750 [Drosophila ficusphila]|uniref:uncharacterized protein LOC108088750 n=1 Tax=Drosophila ficusphila TaxID=30025 RepID=UPI0007E6760A|nr:uncharacterized protein LOC108088750 [Drosophila ficusphila]
MELGRELPTDDASVELDGTESWGEVGSSASLLTLKRSWSQETVVPTAEEDPAPPELSLDDIHLGLLVERGLIEYESLDQLSAEDEVGDYPSLLSRSADRGGIAEIVREMRNEFMVKLSSKAKSLKEFLVQRGLMDKSVNDPAHWERESEPRSPAKVLTSKANDGTELETRSEEVANQSDEIGRLINEINQFTARLEMDPGNADWAQFRANLMKVHKHYVSVREPQKEEPADSAGAHSAFSAKDVSKPLTDLGGRARYLQRSIRGLECKMLTLDQSFEDFCDKFNRNLITKERVERDMVVLATMRDGIGRRLSQMEVEFRAAREHLFSRGKNPLAKGSEHKGFLL